MTFDSGVLGTDIVRRAVEPFSAWLGLGPADLAPAAPDPIEAGEFEPGARDAVLMRFVAEARSAGLL
ncbi:hypothetical protein [Prosthecomicrobium sp. N25]|uniref:hypothetical protein n=1 Tax=Prosthecomicrobium sp. N25 TaxID=3129254 RepID=UPI003077F11E